jgi:nitrate/nitrite transport system ATP-binding protein
MLMTNGPSARIAEIIDVTIPRPRSRETVIEHPHYYKIRNHIIHFLVKHAKHGQGDGAEVSPLEARTPVVVRF